MPRALLDDAGSPQIVGVILNRTELRRATRMRNPPDWFELRLDALLPESDGLEADIRMLQAPLIMTARHPREGGLNRLSTEKRRTLLRGFLRHAACVDIELRSAPAFTTILSEARRKKIRTIVSFHDFHETPRRWRLDEIAHTARSLGADYLKIATRTDTLAELARLREFFQRERLHMKIAVMGLGRLGRISRVEFARDHSALNYAHLGSAQIRGQLSITQLRRLLR